MIVSFEKIKNIFRHVGSGKNLNIFTLVRNVIPYYFSRQGFAFSPLTIYLSINSECNLRCKMCDIGQKNMQSSFYRNLKPEGHSEKLNYKRLKSLIEEMRRFKPKPRIAVTTTEPFLYKELFKVAKNVAENGMEFQVTTNGLLLKQHIEDIFSSGITELAVSVDGPEYIHDEIRGVGGLYSKIVEALQIISENKNNNNLKHPVISIVVTVSNFNYGNIFALVDTLPEKYYDRMIISHMNFMDKDMVKEHNEKFASIGKAEISGLPGETNNYKVDVNELYRNISDIKRKYKKVHFAPDYNLNDLNTFYNKPSQFVWKENKCYIPWFVMEILANGDVVPLTRCIHIKMGNINEHSISEIWNGSKFKIYRKHLKKYKRFPICKRCRGIL